VCIRSCLERRRNLLPGFPALGRSGLPGGTLFGVLDGSGNAPACSPETRDGHEKNERFNISPKPNPRGIKRRRIYTSIFITVYAAFTLSFCFLWNNKSSREGSDAPKPDLESKRGLPGAKLTTESKVTGTDKRDWCKHNPSFYELSNSRPSRTGTHP